MLSIVPIIAADAGFPTTLSPMKYFLQEIDTPGWRWFFRALVILAVLLTAAIYIYYSKKRKKNAKAPGSDADLPRQREESD
jgi:hypothetical protein